MTIHIFDHGLGDWTGHWVNFNRSLAQEFEKRHQSCIHYGNRNIDPDIVGNDLNIIPTFSYHPWDSLAENPAVNEEILCQLFIDGLKKIDVLQFDVSDLLVFVTVTHNELRAILHWASGLPKDYPQIAVLLQFGEGVSAYVSGDPLSPVATIYCDAVRRNSANWKAKVKLFASSNQLAQRFTDLLGIEITPLCMPISMAGFDPYVSIDNSEHVISQTSPEAISVSYVGHAALEKGAQFLHEIAVRTIERYPEVMFKYHINPNKYSKDVLQVFNNPIPGVKCFNGHLEPEQYYELVRNCNVMLLPYDPVKYKFTPSAVFSEALSCGRVLVVPQDTWLSEVTRDTGAGAVCFSQYSVDSILLALHQAIDDLDALSSRAVVAAQKWRRSNNISCFVDILFQTMNYAEPSRYIKDMSNTSITA